MLSLSWVTFWGHLHLPRLRKAGPKTITIWMSSEYSAYYFRRHCKTKVPAMHEKCPLYISWCCMKMLSVFWRRSSKNTMMIMMMMLKMLITMLMMRLEIRPPTPPLFPPSNLTKKPSPQPTQNAPHTTKRNCLKFKYYIVAIYLTKWTKWQKQTNKQTNKRNINKIIWLMYIYCWWCEWILSIKTIYRCVKLANAIPKTIN